MRIVFRRILPLLFLIAGVVLILQAPATSRADIIILNTGGKLDGKIISEDDEFVTIKTKYGIVQKIAREDIDKIERGVNYKDLYEKKLKKLKMGDVRGMFDIAIWCKEHTLQKEYQYHIKQILEFFPSYGQAKTEWDRIKLGLPDKERRKYEKKPPKKKRRKPKPKGERTDQTEKEISAEQKSEAKTLIKEFFATKDLTKRDEILEKLKKFDPIPKSAVKGFEKDIFKKAMKGPKLERKAGIFTLPVPEYPGRVIMKIGRPSRRMAVFIGLHGGGQGSGDGKHSCQKWQAATGIMGAICVFPTATKLESCAWNTEREEKYVLEILACLKRTFPIDTNRIYIGGHSMGGYGSWSIGGHYADIFAGVSPNAGGVFGSNRGIARGMVANFKNTALYFYHSEDDKRVGIGPDRKADEELKELKAKHGPYDYIFKVYNGIGHSVPREGHGPILKWMAKKKRDPFPKKIVWEPSRSYKRIFYWFKTDGGGHIVATREGNEFNVEGCHGAFTIFLNQKMFNASEPVIVKVGGKEVFNGIVKPSLSALVETIADKVDTNMYFSYRIDL